jgi:hypothetical protein
LSASLVGQWDAEVVVEVDDLKEWFARLFVAPGFDAAGLRPFELPFFMCADSRVADSLYFGRCAAPGKMAGTRTR